MIKKILVFSFIYINIFAINSAFFLPAKIEKSYLAISMNANFSPYYYFYKNSPLRLSVPKIKGAMKIGDNAIFNISYSYYIIDKSEIKDVTNEQIIKKSNGKIGKDFVFGGGDIITSVQFNLNKIKLNNTDLLIETKWPDAEFESGLGTDMTDVCFRFINSYFYKKYKTTLNFGLKVISDPNTTNTQSDYYTVGFSSNFYNLVVSINEDIGRYSHKHSLLDMNAQYTFKHLMLTSKLSYKDKFVNKKIGIGYIFF